MTTASRTRLARWNFLPILFALAATGCASSSQTAPGEPQGTVTVLGTEPREGADGEVDGRDRAPAARTDSAAIPGVNLDSLVAVIRDEAAEPRKLSVLPPGVTWSPAPAVEGSPIAFRILTARGGLEPEAVVGRFADGVVRFGRLGGTWLGFAAVPFDTRGPQDLELELRYGDGSVRRHTVNLEVAGRRWDETSLSVAPRYSSPPPEVQDRIARDREQIRAVLDRASREWLLDGPFESPRPFDVTAEFGQKRVFNGELQSRHTGLDLRARVGAPVLASGRGRVALTGDFYFSGNGIILDHGLGVYTGYFHLSEIVVSEGDLVETGELIGKAGATGRVTAAHLHWSLWVDGTGQDAGSLLDVAVPAP